MERDKKMHAVVAKSRHSSRSSITGGDGNSRISKTKQTAKEVKSPPPPPPRVATAHEAQLKRLTAYERLRNIVEDLLLRRRGVEDAVVRLLGLFQLDRLLLGTPAPQAGSSSTAEKPGGK